MTIHSRLFKPSCVNDRGPVPFAIRRKCKFSQPGIPMILIRKYIHTTQTYVLQSPLKTNKSEYHLPNIDNNTFFIFWRVHPHWTWPPLEPWWGSDLLGGSTFVLSARLYVCASPDSNSPLRGLDSWAALDCSHYWNCINKEVQCLFLFGSGGWRKMCFCCYYAARVSDYGVRWPINVSNSMWKWSKSRGIKVIRDLIQGYRSDPHL